MRDATIQSERVSGALQVAVAFVRFYLQTFHRARWIGVPLTGKNETKVLPPCGLIVASNHVSGLDPLLLQVYSPRPIRWMMEREMMIPVLGPFWRWLKIIPVDHSGGTAAVREAFRHLADGGALGIFPEGQIARPPGRIQLFHPGLAQIASRTKVPVAIFLLDGIPPCGNPFWSLFRRSRARARLMAVVPPPSLGEESAWTLRVRRQMADALGVTLDGDADEIASG